ncbi:hypothetical protein HELRODRAFT_162729 [Helobdella robusta]|uniref:Uncharacterized protein n=1 Tax=Helobdella robusta TaxID=6412 RepID=T1ET23_HELRO|nr:hypothetical protein HELRODRAFT_162729 [Helobdella robusta]ESN99218.1 hypothetical protein HELRODRAFT_162729 [Helobdella robusta]
MRMSDHVTRQTFMTKDAYCRPDFQDNKNNTDDNSNLTHSSKNNNNNNINIEASRDTKLKEKLSGQQHGNLAVEQFTENRRWKPKKRKRKKRGSSNDAYPLRPFNIDMHHRRLFAQLFSCGLLGLNLQRRNKIQPCNLISFAESDKIVNKQFGHDEDALERFIIFRMSIFNKLIK